MPCQNLANNQLHAILHVPNQVMSCNELGWEGLSPKKTPVVVLVASSTGDGDPPDNAAKFFATMKCAFAWMPAYGIRLSDPSSGCSWL